ncbi:hypothetical protein AUK11_02605 [bacterium CG2_30_37_16]|nr:MAG: hypothetical protein AUK11_02605 [bacterium CG2_30_37_16]PIP30967.1 MAG: ketoisovalerate oxidoreductase [bacterium (Candidatus Howlettbacteria) CG23_combo_of_CG06-09_8_20_14_all_37_9]PJB05271.1 MAG: ketoisovalerate oxidoreductase [bacterium (Candidatus Howlettbacteria) CG_4_9_14_3_um_filter_37_10]
MIKPLKIIIAGEGGQGVQVIGKTLTVGSFIAGKHTTFIPNYGVEQRGGVSIAFVQISGGEIPFPKFGKADLLVVLCRRAVERTKTYIKPDTLYIYDREQISSRDVEDIECQKIGLDGQEYAKKYLVSKVANVIYLSAIVASKKLYSVETVKKALMEEIGDKLLQDQKLHQLNFKAVDAGAKMIEVALKEAGEKVNV